MFSSSIKVALCEGRHEIPEAKDGSIFGNSLDPLDIAGMQETVASKLAGVQHVDLYVTGLTVALVEVINFCHVNSVELVLWHFDRSSGKYYRQEVM